MMKRSIDIWDISLIAAIVLIAVVCVRAQQAAQAEEQEPEGRIVQIAPDADRGDIRNRVSDITGGAIVDEEDVREPQYWIGVSGRSVESAVLRTHLQLAEDMGVVVEEVVPDSPAAKAGLRRYDILLRANGDAIDNMRVLQQQVLEGRDKPIELKIIRLGKEETLVVVPEPRPEQLRQPTRRGRRFWGGDRRRDGLQRLLEQFEGMEGFADAARVIGPGIMLDGQALNLNEMPSGISVSVRREGDGPAQITVRRGDETWEIVGDDPESLEQLPADLRPFVEQMVPGRGGAGNMMRWNFDFDEGIENMLPRVLEGLPEGAGGEMQERLQEHEQQLTERLEQLERRLREMQERLERDEPAEVE